jgi:hypothetical protein
MMKIKTQNSECRKTTRLLETCPLATKDALCGSTGGLWDVVSEFCTLSFALRAQCAISSLINPHSSFPEPSPSATASIS